MDSKTCVQCKVTKTFDLFYPLKRAKANVMSRCKECWKERQRAINRRRAERPVIVLPETVRCSKCARDLPASLFALNRTRTRGCQSRCRDCHRDQRYGLRQGEYDQLLNQQNGVCAICGDPPLSGRQLEVDHDHKDNHVRGLLCSPCNRGLGAFRDDVKSLIRAAEYLEAGD